MWHEKAGNPVVGNLIGVFFEQINYRSSFFNLAGVIIFIERLVNALY